MTDALTLALCPYFWEAERAPEDRYPCPERYIETCGCQKDGIPQARPRWKRPA